MPLLACVLLAIAYAVAFMALKQTSNDAFDYVIKRIPSVKLYGMGMTSDLRSYAQSWGALVGVALGIVVMILGYTLFGIAAITRLTKRPWVATLVSILAVAPIAALGFIIDNAIPRTAISAALVYFVGPATWYGSLATIAILFVLFLVSFRYASRVAVPETK